MHPFLFASLKKWFVLTSFGLSLNILEKYILVQDILTSVFLIVLLAFKQYVKNSQSQDHLKFKHLTVFFNMSREILSTSEWNDTTLNIHYW